MSVMFVVHVAMKAIDAFQRILVHCPLDSAVGCSYWFVVWKGKASGIQNNVRVGASIPERIDLKWITHLQAMEEEKKLTLALRIGILGQGVFSVRIFNRPPFKSTAFAD